MANIEISKYYARWSIDNHDGAIYLYDAAGVAIAYKFTDSPEEFRVIVDLLRNEKPVFYGTSSGQIRTDQFSEAEPVGEGEGA